MLTVLLHSVEAFSVENVKKYSSFLVRSKYSNMNSHNCNSPREDFEILQLSIIDIILKAETMKAHLKVQTILILLYCCIC